VRSTVAALGILRFLCVHMESVSGVRYCMGTGIWFTFASIAAECSTVAALSILRFLRVRMESVSECR